MPSERQKHLLTLFMTQNILSAEIAEKSNGTILIKFEDGSFVVLPEGTEYSLSERFLKAMLPQPVDRVAHAGHLINPFEMPEMKLGKEASSTPACLGGGNTCHPEATESYPGPGV
ncbi:MAG: hypothetical protein G01um10143_450 [Parcubacteria group bacterium Gr01-1014_3]|nr:MAG: hypothetical protein G01um10143_450 [Parcubacteria group bacterium Gr01-1014_3]